jgi:hypothetical protein
VYFSAYEVAKLKLGIVEHSDSHEPIKTAAAGITATTLSDLIMVPMETIKQRMQLNIRPYSSEFLETKRCELCRCRADVVSVVYCRCA